MASKENKELIRAETRARRASIPGQLRLKAAEAVAVHLKTFLPQLMLKPQAIIGCYLAIGTEINTSPVLKAIQQAGFTIALPRTIMPSSPMEFVKWQTNEPLMQDMLGFPTPAGQELVEPDALIVPLVAFDRMGARIGQGAGFYDRTISILRRHKPRMPVIGLGFACQEVPEAPFELHDQRLDYILTEIGLIEASKELEPHAVSL